MNLLKSWQSRFFLALCIQVGCLVAPLRATTWFPLGPFGGDARSFAADPADPQHLYLGTATGWIYASHDGGATWQRLAQIAQRNDLVIDHILVDEKHPQRLLVGAWIVDHPSGGLYVSDDGGRTWTENAAMRGQSIRSLARSASQPNLLVAGTLTGVFRSEDDGVHWAAISPAHSSEIHEVESIAIDPTNPQVIYAGTWHLPWKTTDGGANWVSIKHGIIEDSDVFSIIVDPKQPNIVYASACSGIYKSENGGDEFKGGVSLNKTQGIPVAARRTRKLAQDPKHLDTVYAGTTEGLYRTIDGGGQWQRMTEPTMIVNDVWVDPSNPDHVLLATDRGGVYSSDNAGVSFHTSNQGFSARQVSSYAQDPDHPATLYVGVINDKETGGVFKSTDGGLSWAQLSDGLDGHDVFSLITTPQGTILAGTGHGIYRLNGGEWLPTGASQRPEPVSRASERRVSERRGEVRPHEERAPRGPRPDAQIYGFASADAAIYAATSQGLYRSGPNAEMWTPVTESKVYDPKFLASHGSTILAADFKSMAVSLDNARTWQALPLPAGLTQIGAVAVDDLNNLWLGGAEGVFLSSDNGATWQPLPDLAVTQVDSIYFDSQNQRLLITTSNSTFVFAVHLPDYKVSYWGSGWKLRFARPVGDHLVGATLYDGVVIQPQMVDSNVGGYNAMETPQPARSGGN